MSTTYEVRTKGNYEVAIYERETGNRYLRMDPKSFSDMNDCVACAKQIARFLTQAQLWS